MRILIVEDEVRLARTLKDLLEQHNVKADMSLTAKAGLTTPSAEFMMLLS